MQPLTALAKHVPMIRGQFLEPILDESVRKGTIQPACARPRIDPALPSTPIQQFPWQIRRIVRAGRAPASRALLGLKLGRPQAGGWGHWGSSFRPPPISTGIAQVIAYVSVWQSAHPGELIAAGHHRRLHSQIAILPPPTPVRTRRTPGLRSAA